MATRTPTSSVPRYKSSTAKPNSESARCKERGTVYPYTNVQPKAYRLRILNASNDRMLNLQMYTADPAQSSADAAPRANTEVKMVPAVPHPSTDLTWPASWPTDGRAGGVPDPTAVG